MKAAMNLTEHLMASAERELGAFISAVSELFSADHAQRAADDWLAELERAELDSMNTLAQARREFRAVTIAAAVRFCRLAKRS
jgi:RecB family exonuclease